MKPKKEQLFYWDAEWVPISKNLEEFEADYPALYEAFVHQYKKKGGDIINERKNLEEKKGRDDPSRILGRKSPFLSRVLQNHLYLLWILL